MEMKKLVLTNTDCEVPDFTSMPWNEAILVMPCHSVCTYWNAVLLWRHCALTGNTLCSCDMEDSYGQDQQPLNIQQQVTVAGISHWEAACQLELTVGMKDMVTMNIATEANPANRARGEIVNIVLDPRELHPHKDEETGIMRL
jgi:hypothetical protein